MVMFDDDDVDVLNVLMMFVQWWVKMVDHTALKLSKLEKLFKKSQGVKAIPDIEDGYTDVAITLPDRFKMPQIDRFDGSGDPMVHLRLFSDILRPMGLTRPQKLSLFGRAVARSPAGWLQCATDVSNFGEELRYSFQILPNSLVIPLDDDDDDDTERGILGETYDLFSNLYICFYTNSTQEDLWQQVFPVGTEWDQLDHVYQYKWNFSNLENAFEEGGELYGQKVYLFGCTEPQLVFFNGEGKVTCIPVVVAVASPFPPSDKIGINSVQREAEEIVPMKQMKMDWVPYIPLEDRAGLRHLKLERVKKFEYCLPYFYQPLTEDELEQSTIVQIIFPAEEKPVFCEFDWELDELEEFTDKLIEEEELSEDQKDAFKDFVKEKVREGKRANREAREARKKALEEMSEDTKAAFQSMKFYKFYPMPTPDTPDVSNVKARITKDYNSELYARVPNPKSIEMPKFPFVFARKLAISLCLSSLRFV
ncbi:hypothetical protein TEA_012534 [Camellia sinensis var. sinensis]|uniref:Uncharacterized protein n=1 Tax=Camellia sinensis var. sinensis TaxID=542762 RepID=A0A4S4E5B8_CAMSN|nr:hypothetical protein TEA_012534 [Camellia sinensis var. sinensis]